MPWPVFPDSPPPTPPPTSAPNSSASPSSVPPSEVSELIQELQALHDADNKTLASQCVSLREAGASKAPSCMRCGLSSIIDRTEEIIRHWSRESSHYHPDEVIPRSQASCKRTLKAARGIEMSLYTVRAIFGDRSEQYRSALWDAIDKCRAAEQAVNDVLRLHEMVVMHRGRLEELRYRLSEDSKELKCQEEEGDPGGTENVST